MASRPTYINHNNEWLHIKSETNSKTRVLLGITKSTFIGVIVNSHSCTRHPSDPALSYFQNVARNLSIKPNSIKTCKLTSRTTATLAPDRRLDCPPLPARSPLGLEQATTLKTSGSQWIEEVRYVLMGLSQQSLKCSTIAQRLQTSISP